MSCSRQIHRPGHTAGGRLGAQVEPLVPTVRVEQTLDDYLAGRDTLVDWLLANGAEKGLSVKKNFQAPMTKEQYLREWGHLDI